MRGGGGRGSTSERITTWQPSAFTKTGDEYEGSTITLSVQAKNVRIVPEDHVGNEKAPSHRLLAGDVAFGAAWKKTSREGRDYLSIKLDDPSFSAPVYASLIDTEQGTYALI